MELNMLGSAEVITISDITFAAEFNEGLVHQVITADLAGARSGNSAQKTRSEVRGGGKKPWRQKGTGRARAGTIRSPLWRSGGVTFASKPRDYEQKVNKKMRRAAYRSILSELIRQDRLIIIDSISIEHPKTRLLLAKLKDLNIVDNNVLIVTAEFDTAIELASRNISHINACQSTNVRPLHLIQHEKVLITRTALKNLEERLG
jgi:large subunit ribosomal protein L4